MIITECPHCHNTVMVPLYDEYIGKFLRHRCEDCGKDMAIEMTRLPDGLTRAWNEFDYYKQP